MPAKPLQLEILTSTPEEDAAFRERQAFLQACTGSPEECACSSHDGAMQPSISSVSSGSTARPN